MANNGYNIGLLTPYSELEGKKLSICYLYYPTKKFETVLMGYSGALGKLIHEKNQKSKISWHCLFNPISDSPKGREGEGYIGE
jgi:hypothetical protein